jgi:L,D-transpeptidase ErfK/SrfK
MRPVLATLILILLPAALPAAAAGGRDDLTGPPVMLYRSEAQDTLLDIARRFDLGFVEIRAANRGVDPWLPGAGTPIVLPLRHILPAAPRRGIVLNLAELRLYFFQGGRVFTHPIGIGSSGRETRTGTTQVLRRRTDPVWTPPPSVRAETPDLPPSVPPGEDNPLGRFALDLAWPGYAIHGTNRPWGVGRRVSHGCIRLYPEDIEQLFPAVPVGTPVTVVDQPVKLGWSGGELFLEVHPSQADADAIEETGSLGAPEDATVPEGLPAQIVAAAGGQSDRIDWAIAIDAVRQRRGVPVAILAPGPADGGPQVSRAGADGDE